MKRSAFEVSFFQLLNIETPLYIRLELLSTRAHTQQVHGVLHISYTMCTRGSPDIYTLSPRACGPRASGVYIRQTTRAHGITIK